MAQLLRRDRLDSARQRSCGLRQPGLCASGCGRADPRLAQPGVCEHRADSARPPPVTADIACTAGRGPAQVGRLPAVRAGRECVAARSRGLQAVQLGPRGVCAAAGGGCCADCVEPDVTSNASSSTTYLYPLSMTPDQLVLLGSAQKHSVRHICMDCTLTTHAARRTKPSSAHPTRVG